MDNKSIVAIEETENNDTLEDLRDFGGSQLRRARYSHYAPSVRSFGALEEDSYPTIRLVVVGDGAVGKTELLITYATNKFPSVYVPTVFDNHTVTVMIGDEPYTLKLVDTSYQEDYDRLRPLDYPQTDVFLVCFSVASPISFKNCKEKWIPEITYHCPGVPFILVGTECQLRDDPKICEQLRKYREAPVAKMDGIALAERMGAVRYLECDALTHYNVKNVFDEAIVAALEPQKKTSHILRRFNLFRKPTPTTSVDTK